jgi:hypothetical protein
MASDKGPQDRWSWGPYFFLQSGKAPLTSGRFGGVSENLARNLLELANAQSVSGLYFVTDEVSLLTPPQRRNNKEAQTWKQQLIATF